MYQVYILFSQKDKRTYVGYTENLKDRLREHNSGKVIATKHRRPFTVLMIERCQTLTEAKHREKYWKNGGGRRKLKYYFQQGFPPQGGEARSACGGAANPRLKEAPAPTCVARREARSFFQKMSGPHPDLFIINSPC